MYSKSVIPFDGNGRLTGARTAQTSPYDRHTCHLCGSALQYHPEYKTELAKNSHPLVLHPVIFLFLNLK